MNWAKATLFVLILSVGWNASELVAQDDSLPAGVVAHYRSGELQHVRIEPRPAFYLEAGQVPAPDFSPGKWSAHWVGVIDILRPGRYRFEAVVRGTVRLRIGDREVLAGKGSELSSRVAGEWFQLKAAFLPFLLFYESPERGPARLQLWWQGPDFPLEPIPSRWLRHRPEQASESLVRWQRIERGRGIARALQCAACHASASPRGLFSGAAPLGAPDLSRVGDRASIAWLNAWLEDPHAIRPDTWMPAVLPRGRAGGVARAALAVFLSTLKGKPAKPPATSEEERKRLAEAGRKLFEVIGCAVCHAETSDRPPVYRLTYLGAKFKPRALAAFLRDPLQSRPSGRMPRVSITDEEALALAHYLCGGEFDTARLDSDLPQASTAELADVVRRLGGSPEIADEIRRVKDSRTAMVIAGRELVQVVGCLACHRLEEGGKPLPNRAPAPGLRVEAGVRVEPGGCVTGEGARSARYALDATEQQALIAYLNRPLGTEDGAEAPTYNVPRLLRTYGCVRCHEWHGTGGLSVDFVNRLRQQFGADHAEAVTPPPLTGVGEKLRTAWLAAVLVQDRRVRPWMPLRMPHFGTRAVGKLARWLAAFDGVVPEHDADPGLEASPQRVEAGRFLVGKGGYGCISCHDMLGRHGEGTRGPELSTVTQRVRYPWFVRWLRDAQRITPGTRMPTIFPQDTTQVRTVLGGDGRAQLDAIWAYLSLGDRAPLPEGLLPPRGLVIEVKDQPYLLRTFMPDTSTRAIAVGFPCQVSYAFDAARGRLAYAWSGGFVDATPVWANRGGDPAILLGPRFWQHVDQFPWYFTRSDHLPPWNKVREDPSLADPLPATELPPQPRRIWFRGYRLDRHGQPTFEVAFDADDGTRVSLWQTPRGIQDAGGPGVVVDLDARATRAGMLWWLLAESSEEPRVLTYMSEADDAEAHGVVVETQTGTVLVVVQGAEPRLREEGGRWIVECRLELQTDSNSRMRVGYWAPYSKRAETLKRLISATRIGSAGDAEETSDE